MSSLLESFSVSGQNVLLAAQKLSIQPSLPEHREELIAATQNVFLGVIRVHFEFFFFFSLCGKTMPEIIKFSTYLMVSSKKSRNGGMLQTNIRQFEQLNLYFTLLEV